ncbi:MAG: methyltransferase domain-containing protein [Candidatus Omnitrophota bacterium]|jgi:SAM-dependent methyltransferase
MKLKDSPFFLLLILILVCAILIFALSKKTQPIYTAPLFIIAAVISLRVIKALKKRWLEYMNGPARYCRGKGIEIGSGGRHTVKGSLLVDIVDDFSSPKSYKVDYSHDAHSLPDIKESSLDYVCSSNVLEHMTDPIKAVIEWLRVLKPGGILWMKIPDMRKTFDRTRQRTKLRHLIEDFKIMVPVDDPTHIEDHNRNSSPPRSEKHPYIHNHVWISDDIIELLEYINRSHARVKVIKHSPNTRRNAQDFWVAAEKA